MVPSKSNNSYFPKKCYSCKSVYGCLNCDSCKYNMYSLGEEDRYEPHPLFYNSDVTKEDIIINDTNQAHNIQLKPNTIEINIPENVESITINFKESSKPVKMCINYNDESRCDTTHYVWLPGESGDCNTLCCDNCGHHYVLHRGSKVPKFCEECGCKIRW